MKCYKHLKTDAIGVCSECGKGLCQKCSVEIGGKLYCKPCIDKVFGKEKKEVQETPKTLEVQEVPKVSKTSQETTSTMKNSVLGQSSFAWMLGILGFFFFPPICWGLGTIFGYMAVSKASENPDIFSKRDITVCSIGAIANLALFVWWGISMINLLP